MLSQRSFIYKILFWRRSLTSLVILHDGVNGIASALRYGVYCMFWQLLHSWDEYAAMERRPIKSPSYVYIDTTSLPQLLIYVKLSAQCRFIGVIHLLIYLIFLNKFLSLFTLSVKLRMIDTWNKYLTSNVMLTWCFFITIFF